MKFRGEITRNHRIECSCNYQSKVRTDNLRIRKHAVYSFDEILVYIYLKTYQHIIGTFIYYLRFKVTKKMFARVYIYKTAGKIFVTGLCEKVLKFSELAAHPLPKVAAGLRRVGQYCRLNISTLDLCLIRAVRINITFHYFFREINRSNAIFARCP